ncbi:ketopantoate reductase family protein [Caldisphaera sp.]|uniref:ketopantoate reductase family protein n=1 Tax=Caldisphaera sp. TaxID=2060322 RepID=UPI003D11B695
MKIGIIGCGAIGSFLSIILNRSGHEITIIEKTKGCKKQKVIVENIGEEEIKVCNYKEIKGQKFDYLIFAVKAYDLEKSIKIARKYINSDYALSTQNGLYSLEKLEKYYKSGSMIIYYGLNKIKKCHSIFNGGSKLIIGCKNRDCREEFKNLAIKDVKTELVDNIEPYRWEKVIVNSAINPVASLYLKKNGFILENKNAYNLSLHIANESKKIASLFKINLASDPIIELKNTIKFTYNNYNSTIQDLCSNKRKTELDYINLALYKIARKIGYQAKYNYFAYKSVMVMKDLLKENNRLCDSILNG